MDSEEMREHIWPILYPEPDDEEFLHTYPHKRLASVHHLDFTYWSPQEFSSSSIWNRVVRDKNDPLRDSMESLTVPGSLLVAATRLFGESLIAYAGEQGKDKKDTFRFYPPVLVTFWSGFEAFVRLQSEFLLAMSGTIPPLVRLALAEQEAHLDDKGKIKSRSRFRPALERYALLLQYGYSYEVDRGAAFWQAASQAVVARDSLAHYHVNTAPALTCRELWKYLEAIALLWIVPSCAIGRSIFWQQYDCYEMLAELEPFLLDFEERPLHKGWPRSPSVIIPAPFEGVDDARYPKAGDMDPAIFSIRAFEKK